MFIAKLRKNLKDIAFGYKLLALFLIVFILPLILFGIISYQNLTKTLQQNAIDYNNDKANLANEEIDYFFDHLNAPINSLQADYNFISQVLAQESDFESTIDYINRDESIYNKISNILIQNKELVSVYVYVDKGDSFYVNFHSSVDTDYNPYNESWYKQLISGSNHTMLLARMRDKQSIDSSQVVPYVSIIEPSIKVEDYNSKIIVQLNIDENFAEEFIDITANDTTEIYILQSNKTLISKSANASIENADFSDFDFEPDKSIKTYGDENLLVSQVSNEKSGLIVMAVSKNDSVIDDSEDYRMILLFFTIAMMILFVIVSVVISVGVSRPIKNLKKIISNVEKGNLETVKHDSTKSGSWLMSAHFDQYLKTINELLKQIDEHISKRHEQEIKILQAQINPHFIYNTLNTIKWLAKFEGNEKTEEGITALIQLLKSTIKFGHNFTSIEEEIMQISDYIKIQRLRYDDSFKVEIHIDEDIKKYKTLKFMLQPIVENAIFHGIDHEEKKGKIIIRIVKQQDDLIYTIKDNGCGMNQDKAKGIVDRAAKSTFTGIGIQNVTERIKKYFGEEYGIDISSKKGEGTTVIAKIPAILYEQDNEGGGNE